MEKIIKYKFGTMFGPAGKSAGIVFCLVAIGMAFIDLKSLILLPLGILLAFTCNLCIIEPNTNKIKQGIQICRFVEFGKWENINSDMFLSLTPHFKNFRYYSRSNRSVDVSENTYRINLIDAKTKKEIPVGDFNSLKEAKAQIKRLSEQLRLDIKSAK